MSATGRSDVRDPADYYATPSWCVHRLLEAAHLPGGLWLDPCAGLGMLLRAVAEKRNDVIWHAIEFRGECLPELDVIPTCQVAVQGSFQAVLPDPRYAVVCTNPPYRAALAFAQHALKFAPVVIFLLRLNWLASAKRADWIRRHLQHLYVLPDRPSFVGEGTDATDYGWFLFRPPEAVSQPAITILATTPAKERAARTARTRGQRDLFDLHEVQGTDNGSQSEAAKEADAGSAGESAPGD